MGVHGMVVFGGRRVFMSHIPMFKSPHDYQLVLEVDVPPGAPSFAGELFTFEPVPFSLDALRTGAVREMKGTLFRGNFEQGGKPVVSDVRIGVKRIVGTPHALTRSAPAGLGDLPCLVIGTTEEAYVLHHPIVAERDFDQIASVRVSGATDADLASGLVLTVPGHPNDIAHRLGSGEVAQGKTLAGKAVALTVGKVLSCLQGPDFSEACADTSN